MNKKLLCGLMVSVASSAISLPAWAQSAAPASAGSAEDRSIPEIIVTAQRREQSLNDVGISINVKSGAELKALNVVNTSDLNKIVPALSIVPANSGYAGTPVYTLRGVGFNEKSLSALSAVSVYQDEAPLAYPYMTAGPLIDLARVEVLKGPQGTLYGQNSTGGSINYIANRPGDHTEAGISGSYGRFNRFDLEGYVGGPMTSTLGVRFAGKFSTADGWQRSVSRPGDRLGAVRQFAGRVLIDWDPSDRFHAKLNLNGWVDESETVAPQVIGLNPADLPFFNGSPFPYPFRQQTIDSLMVKPNNRDTDWTPNNYRNDNSFKQASLRLDYEASDHFTVTSLTTLSKVSVYSPHELDGSAADLNDATTEGKVSTTNQELRVTGKFGGLNVILGGNYSKDKIDSSVLSRAQGSTTGSFYVTALGLSGFGGNTVTHTERESYAGFANVDYDITNKLSFTGGVRYTQVNLNFSGCSKDNGDGSFSTFFGALAGSFGITTPAGPGQCITFITQNFPGVGQIPVGQGIVNRKLDEHNVSWRAGLNFKVNQDTLLYANVSRGYKSGDIPSILGLFDTQLVPVKQEKLTAYEIGAKASLGRLLQINVAGFHYDYRDKQLYGTVQQPDPLGFLAEQTFNIPRARVNGAELDVTVRPARGFTLHAGVGYTDSKVLEAPLIDASRSTNVIPIPANFQALQRVSVVGNPLNLAPKWQVSADTQYEFGLGEKLAGAVGASVSYQSSTLASLGADDFSRLEARTVVGARLGVHNKQAGWSAEVFGDNIFNENYSVAITRAQDGTTRYPGMPATYGIRLSFDFK